MRIVVSRSAPTGAEVFLVRAGQGWSLPEGTCRLAETPHEASGRFLHERWGSGLATARSTATPRSSPPKPTPRTPAFEPIEAGGEWFGLGKVRALRLGPDEAVVARLVESLG